MSAREPLDLDAIDGLTGELAGANIADQGLVARRLATWVPGLVAEVRAVRADLDASLGMHRDAINQAAALRAERDVLAGRLDLEAWERITRERDEARAEVERLTAQLDAVRALHTDSPAGVCPSCYRLSEASQSEVDDGLVDYPCPTLRAMGIEDAGPSRPGPLAGYTVRPLPPVLCGATDLMLFGFGCTKPAGHTGDRHTAEVPGVGSYTWGYVSTPEEAAAGQDTPEGCPNCPPGYDCERGHYATDNPAPVLTERTWNPGDPLVLPPAPDSGSPPGATPLDAAIDADLRMVADTTGVSYEDVRELYDSTGTRAADDPDGDR